MSSSASSDASPSPSPTASVADVRALPTLQRLVAHFVSAKRALAVTQHVQQATEQVDGSRSTVEEIAAARAGNSFVQTRATRQIDILHAIREQIGRDAVEVDDEFQAVIARLDEANDRLQATIKALQETVIDAALDRKPSDKNADDIEDEQHTKTLYDYVNESTYNELQALLKTYIDSLHDSRTALEQHLDRLSTSIAEITALLNGDRRPNSPTVKATLYDEPVIPVAEAFGYMEEHAAEMASLLQSLISHYDLCVSALKHTEGGREAARQAVLDSHGGEPADNDTMDESLYAPKVADSISEEERSEILRVIEGDAAEVEEVADDLRSRGAEIERLYRQLSHQADVAKSESRSLANAVKLVRQIHDTLPSYLEAMDHFKVTWNEIQVAIVERTQDITNLNAFYEEFTAGYGRLLVEVKRRAETMVQMQKVAAKAQKELDRLYEDDRLLREEFVEDVGSFLPSDLWPGVVEAGVRWHVHAELPLDVQHDESSHSQEGIEIA